MGKNTINDYKFAGWLINHSRHAKKNFKYNDEKPDANRVLPLLIQNKVPLISFNNEQKELCPDFFETPQFQAELKAEQTLYENFRNEWAKVREAFSKADIERMFIKSVGLFDYKSSNLDILIKQDKREVAESILKNLGYIQLHNVEEPFKTLFRKFVGGESVSVIHLHNKVAWIVPFHDENLLWERYRKSPIDDLVDIPSIEDSTLILTAHWFYEDKEITLLDIMKISSCLKEDNLDWNYMEALARKMGWIDGFYFALLLQSFIEKELYEESLIQDSKIKEMEAALPGWMRHYLYKKVYTRDISLPFRLTKVLGKSLQYKKIVKDSTTSFSKKVYELYKVSRSTFFVVFFYNLKINIRYQPPMLISISGVDGSGKSTYAEFLLDILNFCELKTHFFWSRVGSSDFLKPFSRISKTLHGFKNNKQSSGHAETFIEATQRRKDLFGKSFVLRVVGLFILLVEMLWQYFFKVRIPLWRKKVVICDRYIYDTLVDISVRYGIDLNSFEGKLFAKILTAFAPKPDMAYVLNISFEEACKRKEVDKEEFEHIKKQINLYQEVAALNGLHKIDSDKSISIKDINNQMLNEILISFYKKWQR